MGVYDARHTRTHTRPHRDRPWQPVRLLACSTETSNNPPVVTLPLDQFRRQYTQQAMLILRPPRHFPYPPPTHLSFSFLLFLFLFIYLLIVWLESASRLNIPVLRQSCTSGAPTRPRPTGFARLPCIPCQLPTCASTRHLAVCLCVPCQPAACQACPQCRSMRSGSASAEGGMSYPGAVIFLLCTLVHARVGVGEDLHRYNPVSPSLSLVLERAARGRPFLSIPRRLVSSPSVCLFASAGLGDFGAWTRQLCGQASASLRKH
jgi:hypothetical protein